MNPEEQALLQQILHHYRLNRPKEEILKETPLWDQYQLLYEWIRDGKVTPLEFINLLKLLKEDS